MFVKARQIISEECRKKNPLQYIRERLRSEAGLSEREAIFMVDELLQKETEQHAQEIIARLITESGIPPDMLKSMLLKGVQTKNIAALRSKIRKELYSDTRLTHREINKIVGLSDNSRHICERKQE